MSVLCSVGHDGFGMEALEGKLLFSIMTSKQLHKPIPIGGFFQLVQTRDFPL
jgi:hypothetical protein